MKWQINSGLKDCQSKTLVDLPVTIQPGRIQTVEFGQKSWLCQWFPEHQTLCLSQPDHPGLEHHLFLRDLKIERDESQVDSTIHMSYRDRNGIIRWLQLSCQPFVPGMDFRTDKLKSGGAQVRAPMAGTILKMLVSQGDTVEKDQILCIIEAMKMENQIKAPLAGTITISTHQPGEAVQAKEKLFVIK